MTSEDLIVWRNLAIIPCVVVALGALAVVLCREWVKRDLRDHRCRPFSVRWRCFASTRFTCAFRVAYADLRGRVHRADAWTYWHRPSVTWERDEVVDAARRPS